MKVPMVHKGQYLVCQIIAPPIATIAINILIQDLNDDVEEVALYNFHYKFDDIDWVNPGDILIIKEPSLQYDTKSEMPLIRVDSPSDVIFVDPCDEKILSKIGAMKWSETMSKDAEFWREKANECFKKREYKKAIFLYDRAIRCNEDNPVLYSNKAEACLQISAFYEADKAAKLALEKGGDRKKALSRMGRAAYGMRQWENAVKRFTEVVSEFSDNSEANKQLKRATARMNEEKTGIFDFKAMYSESKEVNPNVDVSDYKGPIEIANIPGKASKDIQKGTLIAVSKAFASGYSKDFPSIVMSLNMIRNDMESTASTLRQIQTIQKLKNNPQRAKELYDLYDGVIDAARIQQIGDNSFSSYDVRVKEDAIKVDNSHLFILPSYFNHSCIANAHRTFYDDVMVIHVIVDIKKGDEIYLSYIRETYVERKNFKLVLIEMLTTLASMHSKLVSADSFSDIFDSIKYLEDAVAETEDELIYVFNIPYFACNLANYYQVLGNRRKSNEWLDKAFKLSLCTDFKHFATVYDLYNFSFV
uniref:SET domain-containing protein n=1 Tax=Panagrolaimus davidi TaxID=227884 RepID=A0A914P4Q9_9BILA